MRIGGLLITGIFISSFLVIGGCKSVMPQVPLKLAQEQELEEVRIDRKSPEEIKQELIELQKVKPQPYRIAGGDVFNFSVYDNPELESKSLTVTPDGYIGVPLLGPVNIGGKTITEATKLIEDGFSKYIRNPRVALSPIQIQSATFTILGKVQNPNRYPLANNARLTDAVAMGGGLAVGVFDGDSVEIANLKGAYLIRQGKILPINFSKALYEGDMLNNVPLLNGDYIYIPSNLNASVYVLGEVNSPTTIGYKEDLTVLKALAFAHGMNIEHSEDVLIIRGSLVNPKVYKVNIDDILRGEGFDFALSPNDIVFVPKGGLSQYNDVIRKLVPTAAFLNLIAGPFGGANVAISGNSGN